MTTETVIGSTTNGDDKVKPHESYKNDLDVLFKKYQLLASRKPTTWRGHHDSSPDPKTAAQYYEALIRLTQLFIATSKIPLPSEKVEDLESSKKIENLESSIRKINIIKDFIVEEFKLAANDVDHVAKEESEKVSYTHQGKTYTGKFSIHRIGGTVGDFPLSEREKHFSNIWYIYIRLRFLQHVLKTVSFAYLKHSNQANNIEAITRIVEDHFYDVLTQTRSDGFFFFKKPSDYQTIVKKHIQEGTSPIKSSNGASPSNFVEAPPQKRLRHDAPSNNPSQQAKQQLPSADPSSHHHARTPGSSPVRKKVRFKDPSEYYIVEEQPSKPFSPPQKPSTNIELFTAYSSWNQQNEIEQKILSAKDLKSTLEEIIKNKQFATLVERYTYYRNTPSEKEKLAALDTLLLNKNLISFWADILGKKTMLRPFTPMVPLQRHRLNSQPDDKPDGIHVFHLLVGNFYTHAILLRSYALLGFIAAKVALCDDNFSGALEDFLNDWRSFKPLTTVDFSCQKKINEQIEKLKKIGNFNKKDAAVLKEIDCAFQIIKEQIELLRKEQQRDLDFGMHYKEYTAFSEANFLDIFDLRFMDAVDFNSDNFIKFIEKMEMRMKEWQEVHTAPGLLGCVQGHYWIAKVLQAGAKLITPAHSGHLFSNFERPKLYKRMAVEHFKKARVKTELAYLSLRTGDYSALVHNACRARRLTEKLTLNGVRYSTLEEFRDHLTADINLLITKRDAEDIRKTCSMITTCFQKEKECNNKTSTTRLSSTH